MKLERIHIEKLFGKFDYDIDLNNEEGITILTGPNGYGKTTILKILYELFTQPPPPSNSSYATSEKNPNRPGLKMNLPLLYSNFVCYLSDGSEISTSNDMQEPQNFIIPIYLIIDQRLGDGAMKKIEYCSDNLSYRFSRVQSEEKKLSDSLNANSLERLFQYKNPLAEAEFVTRLEKLKVKYNLLMEYGIYIDELKTTPYVAEDGKAISMYLEDWEKKTALYDALLRQIDLFCHLANKKAMVHKTISVKEEGFLFVSDEGKEIPLTALSSGEQNETILLYELIFNVKPDTLVLIDEPETSLHVSWQHEFIEDLREIQKVNPLNFLIATHSPALINSNWHLVQDLYDKVHPADKAQEGGKND